MIYKYLNDIENVQDLKKIPIEELHIVAEELRDFIIDAISKTGGHLAPSLGVVELTLALLYVYDLPDDKILWDVGHQAYPFKVLTGRRDALKNIRQFGGISGFQKRSESEYDVFGAGHASTSISAGLGIAVSNELLEKAGKVIAIIGDGALTGGLAFEGLNNAGHLRKQVMVILNDNEMSISPNVGAISKYLHKIVTNPLYNRIRDEIWNITNILPGKTILRKAIKKLEESLKVLLVPGILFDEMGFRYFGPVDGHNIELLIDTFQKLKSINTPVLLHILTKKGKGLSEAEANPTQFHGISGKKGKPVTEKAVAPAYTKVFGQTMLEIGKKYKHVAAITAAMSDGTGLTEFAKEFPKRTFDVGIAEGHAITFSGGLSTDGIKPFVAIYSTFLQRAIDSIFHDIALQHLPITICIDRGGLVGEDGPTHHGVFDFTFLSMIPDVIVSAPKDGNELRNLMHASLEEKTTPYFIRYPRDNSVEFDSESDILPIQTGSWEVLKEGKNIAVIAIGSMVHQAELALKLLSKKGITPALINARFIKPYDKDMLDKTAKKYKYILTIEEASPKGGLGSTVLHHFSGQNIKTQIHTLALPDAFITHGARNLILKEAGLSPEQIAEKIESIIK